MNPILVVALTAAFSAPSAAPRPEPPARAALASQVAALASAPAAPAPAVTATRAAMTQPGARARALYQPGTLSADQTPLPQT